MDTLHDILIRYDIAITNVLENLEFKAVDIIFASGSLVEGFGNTTSDLDLFVIHKETTPKQTSAIIEKTPVEVIYLNSLRLDIEYWPEAAVINLAQRIGAVDLVNRVDASITLGELDFCHRLMIGVPVFNKEGFERIKKEFDFAKFIDILVTKKVRECEGKTEDCIGALRAHQYETAFLMAREAAEAAIDAYLASKGETNVATKWRFMKLERAFGKVSDTYQKSWLMETPILRSPEDIEQYTKDALAFANDLSMMAQLNQ